MKARKTYKPKGVKGAKEKLYYKDGSDSYSQEKDYWSLSKKQYKKKKEDKSKNKGKKKKNPKVKTFLSFFLVASVIFFIFSVALAVYMFLSGSIFVSLDNISINIEGEETVSSGDSVNLEITVHNKNKVSLRDVELVLRYPEGARSPEDVNSRIPTGRVEIGDLRANEIGRYEATFNLFGGEGESQTFTADLRYSIDGSNAEYEPKKEFVIKIDENPVSLELIGPESVYLNGINNYTVVVQSDSDSVVNDLVVRVDYPLSFYLFDSDDSLQSGLWNIEDIEPGEKKELEFRGIFRDSPSDKESRTVSAYIGPADDIATRMDSSEIVAEIDGNPFEIEIVLDEGDQVYRGERVEGELFWENRVGLDVEKAYLELFFEGESLNSFDGDYSSKKENYLTWTERDLDFSKTRGVIPFFFDSVATKYIKERDLELVAVFEGETSEGEKVEANFSESFVMATTFNLEIENKFSKPQTDDLFKEGDTTYLESTFTVAVGIDAVDDFEINGKFPPYVKVTDVLAGDENFELKEDGYFVWKLNRVESGTGLWRFLHPSDRRIDLKIRVNHQEDSEDPVLIEELTMTGEDTGTDNLLERTFYNISIFGKEFNIIR